MALLRKLANSMERGRGILHGTIRRIAEDMQISSQTVTRLFQCLAELARQQQEGALTGFLRYVELMAQGGHLTPRLFCQHIKHDETQLPCRANYPGSDTEVMLAKTHVIQREWLAVLDVEPRAGAKEDQRPLLVCGALSPIIQITQNIKAETLCELLKKVTALPSEVQVFAQRVRVLETDECGSNLKAEQMLRSPDVQYLHSICAAHKSMPYPQRLGFFFLRSIQVS